MQRMTLREMVGQLVIVPFYGENPASKRREYQKAAAAADRRPASDIFCRTMHRSNSESRCGN